MRTQDSCNSNIKTDEKLGGLSLNTSCHLHIEGNKNISSEIGVILPTYCEAANIEKIIEEIENLNLDFTILVIDDSSPDGTADIVRKLQRMYDNILLYVRPKKLGLGTAITDGFKIFLSLKNPPKYIVTMDADYSHNPKYVSILFAIAKQGYDLVIGDRYCDRGGVVNWSTTRLIISKVANLIAAMLVGGSLRDYTSGLRCYSIGFVSKIINALHSETYEIQIETVKQALLHGFNIKAVPIIFVNRKRGKSKLTFTEIKSFIFYVFKTLFSKNATFKK